MTSARTILVAVVAAAGLAFAATPAGAVEGGGPTPPRLGFIGGDVSFWRPGAEDWVPAQVNTPLAEGDELYVADGANAELQLGARAFVRAGSDTQIALQTLDGDTLQFQVTGGHAAFDLVRLPSGATIEIDTPRAAYTIDRPGYYRVDVDEQRTAFSARRGGFARVIAANGDEVTVDTEQRLVLADDRPGFAVEPAAAQDDWDDWNFERTAEYGETPRSASYVSADVAGVDDLDRYGDWHEEPRYGRVWRPRSVAPDWSPYSTGRWVYDPYYEWTWVDDAPWGWAPYHYGRWVFVSGYWGWVPGPIVVRPVYAPALVAFFGAPHVGVSISVGAPFVSWCPLGFGEPVIPWWGGARFVGRPWWGGWGGPRVVNNVVINNTRIVNVRNITHFQNAGVRNAVVGLDRDHFRRGGRPIRVGDHRNLRPLRGDLGVRPAARSLVPREGRGRRPPAQLQHRPVVTTRPARDPMQRLRARGVETAAAPVPRRDARLVHPRGGADRWLARKAPQPARPGAERGPGATAGHDRRVERERGPRERRTTSLAPPPPRGEARRAPGGRPVPPATARPDRSHPRERLATPSKPPRQHAAPSRPDAPRTSAAPRRHERGAAAPGARPPDERRVRRQTPRTTRPAPERDVREPGASPRPMRAPQDRTSAAAPRGDRMRVERPRHAPVERSARRAGPPRQEAPRVERAPRPTRTPRNRPQDHPKRERRQEG
jgi:hypothetical protein